MDILNSPLGALPLGLSTTAADTLLAALGAGKMFRATVTQAAVAAQLAIAELKNPAASGKILFGFGGDASLVTGQGITAVFDGTTVAPAGVPVNALLGGPASVATIGPGSSGAVTGTTFFTSGALAVVTRYPLPTGFWFALPANHNMQLQGVTANTALTVSLAWLELAS